MSHEVTVPELRQLLACWFAGVEASHSRVEEIGGGLSGARVWKVTVGEKQYSLRRWPVEYPPLESLAVIHRLIVYVDRRGVPIVPVPILSRAGDTVLQDQGHRWELARWLPGKAVAPDDVTPAVLTAAGTTLAQFHRAAADFAAGDQGPGQGTAPGLLKRQLLLESLRDGQLNLLRQHVGATRNHAQRQLADNLLNSMEVVLAPVLQSVSTVSTKTFPLQWCLGDVHREHLLFTGGEVTGLIDFGAARVDSVAADVARLSGSFCGDDTAAWEVFLTGYETIRSLTQVEREAVAAYDVGGLIGAAANWIRWLFIEHQDFGELSVTNDRLVALASRLRQLAKSGGASMAVCGSEGDRPPTVRTDQPAQKLRN